MPTQRRTLKTPPAKAARRLFKTVPQYLSWIKNSAEQLREKEHGSKKGIGKLVRQLASRVLIRARAGDALFREHFEMPEGFPRRVAVQKILVFNRTGDYTLRLPINQSGPLRMFQMIVGHKRDLDNNEAMLRLNQSLTREVKCVLRRHLRNVLDEQDYVSPGRINTWLVPHLKKAISSINGSVTRDYYITTKTAFPKEGMTAVLTFSPKDEEQDSFTIRITFELAISVADLPSHFKVRHPFPRNQPHLERHGRAMIKDIKQSFEEGHRRLFLYCPVTRTSGLPDIAGLHIRAKTYLEYTIERCGTAFTTKSLPNSMSQIDLGDRSRNPRVWDISYEEIENVLFDKLTHFARFRRIQDAWFLYELIATCGNKALPQLNKNTKRAVSLWVFKKGGSSLDELAGAFREVVQVVRGCVHNDFCPSFCQTQVNTMSPVEDDDEETANSHIRVPQDDESSDEEHNESDEETEENGKIASNVDKRSNIDKLLEILYEDNIRKAVYLINIC